LFESGLGIQDMDFSFKFIRHERIVRRKSKIDQFFPVAIRTPAKGVHKWDLIPDIINLPDHIVTSKYPLQHLVKSLDSGTK
jgi:hypothetical protein